MEPGSTKYVKFHIRSRNESGNDIGALGKHSSGLQDLVRNHVKARGGAATRRCRITPGAKLTLVKQRMWNGGGFVAFTYRLVEIV